MSEYTKVEQPFLRQLQALGWEIIDQGREIPADPARSLRANFRQWLLPEVFSRAVAALNPGAYGATWLTGRQLVDLREQLLSLNSSLTPIFAPDTGSGMFSSCSLVTPSLTMDLFKVYIQSYN